MVSELGQNAEVQESKVPGWPHLASCTAEALTNEVTQPAHLREWVLMQMCPNWPSLAGTGIEQVLEMHTPGAR